MNGARSMSDEEEESESGDSSGESPESAADDETYCWIPHKPDSTWSRLARAPLGVFASLGRF
jgi:hypothetical protein